MPLQLRRRSRRRPHCRHASGARSPGRHARARGRAAGRYPRRRISRQPADESHHRNSCKNGDRVTVRLDVAPQVTICAPSLNVLERVPESGAVVFGVRPEHLRTSPATGALPDSDGFDAIVELAEALGHELLLHLRVDGIPLTVRGAPGIRPTVGSSVRVHVDPSHVHLFDAATGVSLR